jgi:branched-chain amino acid transport system permease protein
MMRRPAAPALVGLAALVPFVVSSRSGMYDDLIVAAAYVVMALGLNIVVGFAGLLDLGYVAFVAIGAYTAAYFASGFWGIHVDFLFVLVLAVAATTVAGVLIGLPTLRLRGDYVAIVTLAFGEIIGQVAANGDEVKVFGGTLTAGPNNIGPLDQIDLPLLKPFSAVDPRPWYWFALTLVALALGVNVRLRASHGGRG